MDQASSIRPAGLIGITFAVLVLAAICTLWLPAWYTAVATLCVSAGVSAWAILQAVSGGGGEQKDSHIKNEVIIKERAPSRERTREAEEEATRGSGPKFLSTGGIFAEKIA